MILSPFKKVANYCKTRTEWESEIISDIEQVKFESGCNMYNCIHLVSFDFRNSAAKPVISSKVSAAFKLDKILISAKIWKSCQPYIHITLLYMSRSAARVQHELNRLLLEEVLKLLLKSRCYQRRFSVKTYTNRVQIIHLRG